MTVTNEPDFERLLEEENQAFADAEVFDSWMPPDGEYLVVVKGVRKGMTVDDENKDRPWWRITCRIEEENMPELHGREFGIYLSYKAYGIVKAAAAVLGGVSADTLTIGKADGIITNSVGTIMRVGIETTYSRKRKREFTGASILEVLLETNGETGDVMGESS